MDRYNNGEYLATHPGWHQEDSPFKARQVRKALLDAGLKPRSIAEVGCGAGGIIAGLAETFGDAQCMGYEISRDAFKLCQSHTAPNLRYVLGDFSQSSDRFDVIVSCDVLEHVDDYLGFIRVLGSRASHVVLNIPLDITAVNLLLKRFEYARRHSGHLHYFTRETALASVEHAGLKVRSHFLAPGGIERAVTLRQKLAAIPRLMAGLFGRDFSTRFFGGCSLIVLADGAVASARQAE